MFLDINKSKCSAILWLQGFHHGPETLAQTIFCCWVVRELLFELCQLDGKLLVAAVAHRAPTIVVDDRIPEHTIEPGNNGFMIINSVGFFDETHECCLDDVFGIRRRAHSFLHKGNKPLPLFKQLTDDSLGQSWTHSILTISVKRGFKVGIQ